MWLSQVGVQSCQIRNWVPTSRNLSCNNNWVLISREETLHLVLKRIKVRINKKIPKSILTFSPWILDFQQNPFNANGGQRLSPQQQQINQQLLLNNFQQGNSSNSNGASQLSPRQPPFTQQSTNPAQSNPANWNQQTPANNIRLNLQQNNPMLNAQLSVRLC